MPIGTKSKAAIETELDTCINSAERYFLSELDLKRFNDQLSHIIDEKIQDYYFQRFRDWSVPDLIQMKLCVIAKLKAGEKTSK